MISEPRVPSPATRAGFTLIELMIVVVIIAVLAAIALPSYNRSVLRGQRSAGKAFLLDLSGKQDLFKLQNRRHAADFLNLRMTTASATTLFLGRGGKITTDLSDDSLYRVELLDEGDADAVADCGTVPPDAADGDALAFRAVAVGRQAGDSQCTTLLVCFAGSAGFKNAFRSDDTTSADIRDTCWDQKRS